MIRQWISNLEVIQKLILLFYSFILNVNPVFLIGKRTKDVTINNNEAIHDIIWIEIY